jgi:CRISPR-associated protein Csm1
MQQDLGEERMSKQKLSASCRVALAAFLHDLGKFAERARIPEAREKDADGNTRQAINELLACPEWKGRRTHIHAAYTAIGLDILEAHLPELVGDDMTPFAPWRERNADDSLVNAAARHHRPDTFLQWIIASADRLASGFERKSFAAYNESPDDEAKPLNHYTTRQWTLLEDICLPGGSARAGTSPKYRYPLKPLSPEAIFPAFANDCESADKAAAQAAYLQLWQQFQAGLQAIPKRHRASLPLWLDHFDSLWLAFTHAIPSATAGIGGNVRPDVALYDHSKTTAALAVALWRYHTDLGHDAVEIREQLCAQWDRERSAHDSARAAWEDEKFLLVQGDFTGIQDFIFAGGESQRQVARLLRGRSFHVSLLSELAALRVLEALDLPTTSQVVNAAGKFLIVAPNTPDAQAKLREVQRSLDAWFLAHTWGQSGVNLAWLPARAADFRQTDGESPFRDLIKRLFEQLDAAKLQRFDLCGEAPPSAIHHGFLDRFSHGECKIDGRSPAHPELDGLSELAADQVNTGKWLAHRDRLLVSRDRIAPLNTAQKLDQLRLPIFGYHVLFTGAEDASGKFGAEAQSGNLLRAWDFSLPQSADAPLWNGYARRAINAFVPKFGDTSGWDSERYKGLENLDDFEPHPNAPHPNTPKTLNHLARDDRVYKKNEHDEHGRWVGAEALITLKGDIDNLGLIFQQGLARPTFARMAALSRQVNAFFTVYLPWLCQKEFPNTYTVFAGGDDFFLIGPWRSTIKLAARMRDEFARYVAQSPDIHFSAGLTMSKPGLPIRQLAQQAEHALDAAKAYSPRPQAGEGAGERARALPKNAVTCFGHAVSWAQFAELMAREAGLARLSAELGLSTGYLYGLLSLTDMAADTRRPESALWHSRFAYRTRRLLETKVRNEGDRDATERRRRSLQEALALEIAGLGIAQHGAAYKIALFTHLYQQRD